SLPTMTALAGCPKGTVPAGLVRPAWSLRGYPGGTVVLPQDAARPTHRYRGERVAPHETGWDTPPLHVRERRRRPQPGCCFPPKHLDRGEPGSDGGPCHRQARPLAPSPGPARP